MAEDRVEVSRDGLMRLQSAAEDFARAEIARIVEAVLDDLRSQPANDTFGEVAARHLWDEYCWSVQEGPFDDDLSWDDVRVGSLSGAFDDLVRAIIQSEVEKLARFAQMFLSALAFEEDGHHDDRDVLGSVWIDGIVDLILEAVNERASERNLELIGPHRGDVIGYEVEGSGMVWSVLSDRGEAMDLIARHADALLDPDDNLSGLAKEMVEAFMVAATEDAEETALAELLVRFDAEIRSLLRERDVLPSLEDMRESVLAALDD